METEEAFLESLESVPDDHDLRMVYADWLAERGDARAEFLHLEIELEEAVKPTRVIYLNDLLLQLSRKINRPKWVRRVTHNRASQLTLFFRRSAKRRLRRSLKV